MVNIKRDYYFYFFTILSSLIIEFCQAEREGYELFSIVRVVTRFWYLLVPYMFFDLIIVPLVIKKYNKKYTDDKINES